MPSYVVTGASRGIGHAFVEVLSRNTGNTIFALVRDKQTIREADKLQRPNVHILQADVTDHEALKTAAKEVSKVTGGTLDMLINNAAFIGQKNRFFGLDEFPSDEVLTDTMHKCIDTNVLGVIHATNAFLPLLKAGNTKKVVCISTLGADLEMTVAAEVHAESVYAISKAALNMAVAKYAARYKKDGFVFLAISPGLVQTDALKGTGETPTPEELAYLQALLMKCRQLNPSFTGPAAPEESVSAMLSVVDKATPETSGAFISHKGNKEWL